MPHASSSSSRRRFAVAVLLALLCALGLGYTATAAEAAPGAAVGMDAGAGAGARATAADTGVVADKGEPGRAPGCGKDAGDDTERSPVTPTRGSSSHELLPALYETRAATGSWGLYGIVLAPTPEHIPPPLAAPSPIDLSIQRV